MMSERQKDYYIVYNLGVTDCSQNLIPYILLVTPYSFLSLSPVMLYLRGDLSYSPCMSPSHSEGVITRLREFSNLDNKKHE